MHQNQMRNKNALVMFTGARDGVYLVCIYYIPGLLHSPNLIVGLY